MLTVESLPKHRQIVGVELLLGRNFGNRGTTASRQAIAVLQRRSDVRLKWGFPIRACIFPVEFADRLESLFGPVRPLG